MKTTARGFDVQCAQLAERFLPYTEYHGSVQEWKDAIEELAQLIQDTIESHLTYGQASTPEGTAAQRPKEREG